MTAQIQAHTSPYHAYRNPNSTLTFHPLPCATTSSYHQYQLQHQRDNIEVDPHINHLPNNQKITNAYMIPILPQPAPQYIIHAPSANHGTKRSAPDPEDELERSSHISTQFKKLRLSNNAHRHQSPLQPQSQANSDTAFNQYISNIPNHAAAQPVPTHNQYPNPVSSNDENIPTLPNGDFMTIDETPHKIYIGDLDSEIAAIEASEQPASQFFLPDFEKQIGAIPDHILRSNSRAYHREMGKNSNDGSNAQALVLYREPSSISVPEEEDAVRKAVAETRREIRERMRREQQKERETSNVNLAFSRSGRNTLLYPIDLKNTQMNMMAHNFSDDADAMEVE